jgi:GT2 family glycosyltransferase
MEKVVKDVSPGAVVDGSRPKPSTGNDSQKTPDVSGADASLEGAPEGFDEIAYAAAFPDVARSLKTGEFRSALHHYRVHGQRENRLADVRYQKASSRGNTASFPPASIDAVFGCKAGQCLVYGWVKDNDAAPIGQLTLLNKLGLWGTTQTVSRCRRKDVVDSLGLPDDRPFGFWAIMDVEQAETAHGEAELVICAGRERKTFNCQIRPVSEERFREIALEYVARAQHVGDARVETFLQLDDGLGELLIDLNLGISRRIALGAQTLQFGAAPSAVEGSMVVCLLGKPELLSLQCALFSKCRNVDRYEFIYVSNSPEIAERLVRDATIANRVYGISIRLVILPGNAGFGIANNVAANVARSDRILFINPDVFPVDADWPSRHSQLVKNLPPEQVALFGVPLFYDDGSLMHGGMYFEVDVGLSFRDQRTKTRDMLRVEHYGKGAPPATKSYLSARPVPAVTGAFMSVDRAWFESLGGFSPEYIFGHYEDADLCLKSLNAGKPTWIHPVPFLHFEGKGATPRPSHDGASLVNRWHFTTVWGEFVKTHLCGKTPEYLTLRGPQ